MSITGGFVGALHIMEGKSTDNKPDKTIENTYFFENNTGKVYYYSEGEWAEAGEMIAKMIANILGKGGDLPIVTGDDNGKVLGVSNGAWAVVSGGSGMEKFTCTFTLSGSTLVCDKTFAEITAARTAGKYVEGVYGDNICPLTVLTASAATFQMLVQNSGVFFNAIYLTSADTCIPDTVPIAPGVVTDNSPTPSIAAAANTIYKFGEISLLTISSFPASGDFRVEFTSGSTATVLTVPAGTKAAGSLTPEASKDYELDVHDGKAVLTAFEAVSTS